MTYCINDRGLYGGLVLHEHLKELHGIEIIDPYSLLWQGFFDPPGLFRGIKYLHHFLHQEAVFVDPHQHRAPWSLWDRWMC